jgi:DNA-binding XRE family transcriptional regulator
MLYLTSVKGKELKNKRESAGLTQQELADALGVHWTTISRMEHDRVKISKATALAVTLIFKQKSAQK